MEDDLTQGRETGGALGDLNEPQGHLHCPAGRQTKDMEAQQRVLERSARGLLSGLDFRSTGPRPPLGRQRGVYNCHQLEPLLEQML